MINVYRRTIMAPLAAITISLSAASDGLTQSVPVPEKAERANQLPAKRTQPKQRVGTSKPPAEKRIYQSACPAVLSGNVEAKMMPPIEKGACGERSPLRVTKLAGISLSSPAIMNCRMATSMAAWAKQSANLSSGMLKRRLKSLQVSTSYQCRRRNNAPTGKISEHGFANAMDIIGFSFDNGKAISIEKDWGQTGLEDPESGNDTEGLSKLSDESRFLRRVRTAACDHFSTVLSPETNAAHADHLHFDLGCHGKNCTYLICE